MKRIRDRISEAAAAGVKEESRIRDGEKQVPVVTGQPLPDETTDENKPIGNKKGQTRAEKKQAKAEEKQARAEEKQARAAEKQAAAEEKQAEKKRRRIRRRIKASAAAGITAVSVLIGGLFSSPGELLGKDSTLPPDDHRPVIVEMAAEPPIDDIMSEEDDDDEKKKSLKDSIRAFFRKIADALKSGLLRTPLPLRLLVGVPLWALGYGLIAAATALWTPILQPVLAVVLKWLIAAGILLLAVLFTVKAVAPDVPLKKLLTKKLLIAVIACGVALCTLDAVLPLFVEKYEKYRNPVCFLLGLALLLAIVILREVRKGRRSK